MIELHKINKSENSSYLELDSVGRDAEHSKHSNVSKVEEYDKPPHLRDSTKLYASETSDYEVFLGMRLNPGVSKVNLMSFYLLWLIAWVELNICLGTVQFIFGEKEYYAEGASAGAKFNHIGFIVEIIVILEDLALGPMYDSFGRKNLIIVG